MIIQYMLFLSKKHKKRVELAWGIVSIFVILSMVLLYLPIF